MTLSGKLSRLVLVGVFVTAVSAGLAYAQIAGKDAAPRAASPHVVQEFSHQEVQAAAVVATLNDLSKQGWEVFQVIPSWTLKNEDGVNDLIPKSYQVFARRPAPAK